MWPAAIKSAWLSSDMRGGLSVAAVAISTGIAYAQLVAVVLAILGVPFAVVFGLFAFLLVS